MNKPKIDVEHAPMPLLAQNAPFDAQAFYAEAAADPDAAYDKYRGKRMLVTGIASKIGPDIHGKPSVELSDTVGGHCHVLAVFPSDAVYGKVSPGDRITVCANYLMLYDPFGVVMKLSELV